MHNHLVVQNKSINTLRASLERINLRTDFIHRDIGFTKLYRQHSTYFAELGEEMKIEWDNFLKHKLVLSFNLLHLIPTEYQIFLEPEYHFNRYRLKTLRNSLYNTTPYFDIQKWRSYCRSREKESLKAGLTREVWSSPLSEKLLNESDAPGYFGTNGSAGWKLIAIANFCLDLYFHQNKSKFIRLSPYDGFLSTGKIELLGNSLQFNKNEKPIQQYISRKIGYKIPTER